MRRHDGCGEDSFVFRKGLLGDERPRKVQIATGPPALDAERADVTDHTSDLPFCELVAERRHHPIESARRAALMDDREPVEIRLCRRQAAVSEIRRIDVEAADPDRLAASIGPMTRRARRLVELLPTQCRAID